MIAPDGTVYLGTEQGRLIGLHADGSASWSRQLPSPQAILASPAVGGDGSIYVVGVSTVTDHRVTLPSSATNSTLHKFAAAGALLWSAPFPEFTSLGKPAGRGATTAPPNIWKSGGVEVVMVPVIYKDVGRYQLHLLAFSTGGAILADQKVTTVVYESQAAATCPTTTSSPARSR